MRDDMQIQRRKLLEIKFSYPDPDFYEHPHPTYDVTLTIHRFRVRRRLVYLRFLMRRHRGRKLLGAKTWYEKLTFYGVKVDV